MIFLSNGNLGLVNSGQVHFKFTRTNDWVGNVFPYNWIYLGKLCIQSLIMVGQIIGILLFALYASIMLINITFKDYMFFSVGKSHNCKYCCFSHLRNTDNSSFGSNKRNSLYSSSCENESGIQSLNKIMFLNKEVLILKLHINLWKYVGQSLYLTFTYMAPHHYPLTFSLRTAAAPSCWPQTWRRAA